MRTFRPIWMGLILLFLGTTPAFPQNPGPEEDIARMAREKAFEVRRMNLSAREERLNRMEQTLNELQRQMRQLKEEVRDRGAPAQESREMEGTTDREVQK